MTSRDWRNSTPAAYAKALASFMRIALFGGSGLAVLAVAVGALLGVRDAPTLFGTFLALLVLFTIGIWQVLIRAYDGLIWGDAPAPPPQQEPKDRIVPVYAQSRARWGDTGVGGSDDS